MDAASVTALSRLLMVLANDKQTPVQAREDALVMLSSLDRIAPPAEAPDPQLTLANVEVGGEKATRTNGGGTWMSGEVQGMPAAESSRRTLPITADDPPGHSGRVSPATLDVTAKMTPAGPDVQPNTPAQADNARILRELMAATVSRKLSPLGSTTLDMLLALERREIELHRFFEQLVAGHAVLIGGVDFTTPAGDAIRQWYNGLIAWLK